MWKIKLISILAILWFSEATSGQGLTFEQHRLPVINLNEGQKYYEIGESVEILEDPSHQLTFDQVRSSGYDSLFHRSEQSIPNFGYSPSSYWLKFHLRNSAGNNKTWILETGNVLLSKVQFFSLNQNGEIKFKETGKNIPVAEREIKERYLLFDLDIPANEEAIIFLHVAGNENKLFKVAVWEKESFTEFIRLNEILLSFYFGILLALAVYNLFLYFAIFDASFLLYVLFISSMLLTQLSVTGIGFQYMGGEFLFNNSSFLLYCFLTCLFGLLFGNRFLSLRKFYPYLNKTIEGGLVILFVLLIIMLVGIEKEYSLMALKAASMLVAIIISIVFVSSILVMRKGYRPARYFLIGWSVLFCALFVMLLKHLGYLPINSFTTYFMKIATAFEVLIFSLGLADRFHTVTKNLNLKTLESERLAESEKMKTDFFSNISHEFRTPLSLIISPIEKIIEVRKNDPALDSFKMIHRNARRLLQLVNQLLYLTKLDSKAVKLRITTEDLIKELRFIASYFDSVAEEKEIIFTQSFPAENSLNICVDKEKLEITISNLLSNALKFTSPGGKVSLSVTTVFTEQSSFLKSPQKIQWAKITVGDSGVGIPKDQQEKIFDRFFQVNNSSSREFEGTGIGLSLVKELVQLHRGSIEVKSEPGKGSEFIIHLPLDKSIYNQEDFREIDQFIDDPFKFNSTQEIEEAKPLLNSDSEKYQVLIVEDNSDFRTFTKSILIDEYDVSEASDGQNGWEVAQEKIPDLIVADMMMPKLDGIQLCKKLKEDIRTSHIPVILLTARQNIDFRLKGLETGADDYVTKPFHIQELRVRIRNLITQREKLKEKYNKLNGPLSFDIPVASADEKFIALLVAAIEKNLTSEFDIEFLAGEVGMSRVQLFRKLKAITGQAPTDFVRMYKLNKAANFLQKKAFESIAEVAYASGFSSPSHFAESFKKQFGKSPSDFQKEGITLS